MWQTKYTGPQLPTPQLTVRVGVPHWERQADNAKGYNLPSILLIEEECQSLQEKWASDPPPALEGEYKEQTV